MIPSMERHHRHEDGALHASSKAMPETGVIDSLRRLSRTMTFRLTTLYVSIALLAGALIFIAIYHQMNGIVARQVTLAITAEARDLRIASRHGGPLLLAQLINARARSGDERLYLLIDNQRRRLAGNIAAWPKGVKPDDSGTTFRYIPAGKPDSSHVALGAGAAISLDGGFALLIGRNIEEQRRLGTKIGKLFVFGFVGLALAGILGGLWASRFVLSRIGSISATARSIMAGSFSERVPISGSGDEIDQLALDLNEMLARIERLMASLKEVSDNIAHDLKTPLNRLRNQAEEALRSKVDPKAYRDALEGVTEEADELIKTFNALLLIAKLEAGTQDDSAERINVVELVGDLAELYQPVADEAGRKLTFLAADMRGETVAETIQVRANRHLIGQAVANMIDNALKYGERESTDGNGVREDIVIAVDHDDRLVRISVTDHGPGVPASDRQRVLERFVRLEKSRSRPGTGLGLALVAAVARLSGGKVRLDDNGPGLRISLILPRSRHDES